MVGCARNVLEDNNVTRWCVFSTEWKTPPHCTPTPYYIFYNTKAHTGPRPPPIHPLAPGLRINLSLQIVIVSDTTRHVRALLKREIYVYIHTEIGGGTFEIRNFSAALGTKTIKSPSYHFKRCTKVWGAGMKPGCQLWNCQIYRFDEHLRA